MCRRPPTGSSSPRAPTSAGRAAEAGLRYAYLQFDGIGNAANEHRKVGNLFDVKLRAIENLHRAGVDIVPVTTLVNGINNEQVGRIIQFALDNPKKIPFISFQPVSFTGRDEAVTDERRQAQRYTLSHMAHDVKKQTGLGEPARDWFPLSFISTFSDWSDLVHGPQAQWGQLSCGCHPNCGVGMAVMVDKLTREAVPVTAFLRADRLARDVARINDAARGKWLSILGMALAVARNYDPFQSPTHFKLSDMLRKFDKTFGATGRSYGKVGADRTRNDIEQRRADRWNFLLIAGMWFQDLFNYDFRRTEQCIIPYATQEGEISFCAYNTGVGWRNIVEKMHMTATLTRWYEEHGRHEIFAGGKQVPLASAQHSMVLREEIVTREAQHDLDRLGIAKNAREEKLRARAAKQEHERMARLYREGGAEGAARAATGADRRRAAAGSRARGGRLLRRLSFCPESQTATWGRRSSGGPFFSGRALVITAETPGTPRKHPGRRSARPRRAASALVPTHGGDAERPCLEASAVRARSPGRPQEWGRGTPGTCATVGGVGRLPVRPSRRASFLRVWSMMDHNFHKGE